MGKAASPSARFTASVQAILAKVTASAIFTFILPVPAAAASTCQVLAPSPMVRNSASPAARALTAQSPGILALVPGKFSSMIAVLPGLAW